MAACSSTQVQFGPQQSILSLLTSASVGGIKTDLSVKSRSQLVCHVKAKERKTRDTKTPELWLTIELAHIFSWHNILIMARVVHITIFNFKKYINERMNTNEQ